MWLQIVVSEADAVAYDVVLSAMFSIPLVGPLPSLAASVGTKPERKQIFMTASRRVVVKLDDEETWRVIVVKEVGKIVEKGLSAAGLRMEKVVVSHSAIVLIVSAERTEEKKGGVKDEEGTGKKEEKTF
ncbi:uncharacterized protein MONOS_89 [Monocercomonoides exilis]|uniref:uncharacterized protein n=1 Tax=Monocercomonoides exilis TaxID=2049356 RepID=UPI003559C212|nr:hypothetical protein MONOS_89 [Monocercomonoides exilis]|eukprot:MONOS_89.1-p1 / transcript=MONOS_89.1 / gene=MONOS_89 / organism=Monocercomonoides_exilis_PA203 / gene_product=unspecified product / transcript_product=unspecified product / location=Mono_scaffold00002:35509-36056(-) / protein_length=129 / sequence_SO=supercontig / SO=protein_coding / is_pseudo=false